MRVESEIVSDAYRKLIEYAYWRCDAVMLTIMEQDGDYVRREFQNDLLKKRNDLDVLDLAANSHSTWGCYNDRFGAYFYKFSAKMKEYLLSNNNLFDWRGPEHPENPSFFRDGYCWLLSDTPHKICRIFCENDEEYKYLKSIGIEFSDDKYSPTVKDERYFEWYRGVKVAKDTLLMSDLEYERSIGFITDADKIRRLTMARKNLHYLHDGDDVHLSDSIKLNPGKVYKFHIECIYESDDMKTSRVNLFKTIDAKSGAAIETPPIREEILAGKRAKRQIFWFSDKKRCSDLIIRPRFGSALVYFAYTGTKAIIDDYEELFRIAESPDAFEKYLSEDVEYEDTVETPFTSFDAGMRIEKISKNKRIYHCRTEWHHGEDDLIFSVEWEAVEEGGVDRVSTI